MTEEELALEALAHAHAAKEARAGGGLPKQIVPYGASTVLPNSAEYFAQYIKGASFETKRNLLGIRFKRGTFNFAIGDDNRTYLTYACGVEIVDRQPAYQKRKKRSNAHTLEIEMLETATHKLRDMHKEAPHKPQPSPILEKMGLGLLPRPERACALQEVLVTGGLRCLALQMQLPSGLTQQFYPPRFCLAFNQKA